MINNLNLKHKISNNWLSILLSISLIVISIKYFQLNKELEMVRKNSIHKNKLLDDLEDEKQELEYEKQDLEDEKTKLENERDDLGDENDN